MDKEPNKTKLDHNQQIKEDLSSNINRTGENQTLLSELYTKCENVLLNFENLVPKEKRKFADDFLSLLDSSMNKAIALYTKHIELFDTDQILKGYREEIEEKYKGDLIAFETDKLLPLRLQLLESKLNPSFNKYSDSKQIAYSDLYNEICKLSPQSGYNIYETNSNIIDNNLRLKGAKDLNWNTLKRFYIPFSLQEDMTLIEQVNGLEIYYKPSEVIGLDEERVIKNILLIGEVGSGKSSLINSMINYLLGVNYHDSVRIKSLNEATTKQINSYIIRPDPKRSDALVRFIDTPGIGINQERDKINSTAIWDYIVRYQYDLHAICFVIKSGSNGLSPIQKFIILQIKQLFGKEVDQNLLGLFTFAKQQIPQSDQSIEDSGIPLSQIFNINNAAFLPCDNNGNSEVYFTWEMGIKNCSTFLKHLCLLIPISLDQTKEVIQARNALEVTTKQLQVKIDKGIKERKRLEGVYAELKKNKANIDNGINFEYIEGDEEEIKHKKPPGEYTTNCINCHNMTCHRDCAIQDNSKKMDCWAMTKGYCRICPTKCHWSQHANLGYYTEKIIKKKTLLWEDTRHEYDNGFEGQLTAKRIFDNLNEKMNKLTSDVIKNIHNCRANLEQLNTISLKGFNENISDYINIMIEVERKEKSQGYLERIQQIEEVRDKFALMNNNDLSAPDVIFDSEEVKRMTDDYKVKKNAIKNKEENFKKNCSIY